MIIKNAIRVVLSASLLFGVAGGVGGCASDGPKAKVSDSKSYVFWPAAPDEPRIQYLGSFNSSEDVTPDRATNFEKLVFGKDAVREAYVNKPYGVAIRGGCIYICDIRAKALIIMDLAKKQTRLVGVTGSTRLERPVAVAVGEDGQLYVADGIHGAILVFDAGERYTRSIVIPKLKPSGVAIRGNRLYVSDIGRQNVLMLDAKTGATLGEIGSVGDENGQFRLPVGVSLDREGNLFVSDMMRCRVQKFTADGTYLGGVGQLGDSAGSFARPKHLAVDSEGIVYVIDSGFQNVQMFNDDFQLLMHFGAAGDFPGAMNLPVGIAVADGGAEFFKDLIHPGFACKRLIVVANQFGDGKVSVYGLGDRREGYSLADMRSSAMNVESGVAPPSAESLKFQNIGGVEPLPDGTVPLEKPAEIPAGKPAEKAAAGASEPSKSPQR